MPHRATHAAAVTVLAIALAAAGCTTGPEIVHQEVALTLHPQLAQPGRVPAGPDEAQSVMTASFEPARKGRTALLQLKQEGEWTTVERGQQNAQGRVEFAAPYATDGQPATYRVYTKAFDGLDSVASESRTTSQAGEADFTDDFSGNELGPDWHDRLQGYSAESKRTCAKADPRAVAVRDGVLRLSVMKDPDRVGAKCSLDGQSYDWRINGHIGTQGTRSFTYGYAAARIKFQPLRGQHGSFWLQPATREAEEGAAEQTGAEIDVIEWFGEGDRQGGLASFIYHYPEDGEPGVSGEKVGGYLKSPERFGEDWASEFHVFSVEWTPSEYVFRIDGQETFRTAKGVSGQPQYLILSLLSSDYEIPRLGGEEQLPQHMYVDWVRFWERPA